MPDNKSPSFPLFVQDFLVGCRGMTESEKGQYITMLCISWDIGPLPERASDVKRECDLKSAPTDRVLKKFPLDGNGRLNPRLERERKKQEAFRASRSANATRRWNSTSNARASGSTCETYAFPIQSSSSDSNTPSSPPVAIESDPIISTLRWAGVGGGAREAREKPGLTPFDVLNLVDQSRSETIKNPPAWIVHKLRNGYEPLQKFTVEQVKRWVDRGYVESIADQPISGRTGFSNTTIIIDVDGEIPVEVPAENLVPENIKLKLPLPARSQRA